MRCDKYIELERYYDQMVCLIINKSDYSALGFHHIKTFYKFKIKSLRKHLIKDAGFVSYELNKPSFYQRIKKRINETTN